MTTQCNVTTGRAIVLMMSLDDGATYKVLGGVQQRDITTDDPSSDVTNSATSGNYAENEANGYKTVTLSASGVIDNRVDADLYSTWEAFKAFYDAGCCGKIPFKAVEYDCDGNETGRYSMEGNYHVNNVGLSAEQQGKASWTLSAVSSGNVSFAIAPPQPTP